MPEVALGVLAGTGGTARLSRLVGKARAMEIMVTGRKFSFEEAKEMDLVHDLYDSMNLDEFRQDVPGVPWLQNRQLAVKMTYLISR